jgi:hypothetical protein
MTDGILFSYSEHFILNLILLLKKKEKYKCQIYKQVFGLVVNMSKLTLKIEV